MKKTSATYTLSYLAKHPVSRKIVFKHLRPLITDDQQLYEVHGTLEGLFHHNMGGGIPYEVIIKLIHELDSIPISALES